MTLRSSETSTASKSKPKIEKLELHKETVQDLTQREAEAVEGGNVDQSRRFGCTGRCKPSKTLCPTNVNECVLA